MGIKDCGPAFPGGCLPEHPHTPNGMALRDWLAGQAMAAVMAEYFKANGSCLGTEHAPRNCAAHACTYADAMLAASEKATHV